MSWIKNLGLNRDKISRFLIVINIINRDKVSLRIVADNIESAKVIATELEEEKRLKKLDFLRKSEDGRLTADDITVIKNHIRESAKKYNKELNRIK